MAEPWPVEIRLSKDRRTLTVTFDNAESHALPAEYLRVYSPSAEVQGHSPEQRVTVGGKAAVEILKVEPVGNYAVRLNSMTSTAPESTLELSPQARAGTTPASGPAISMNSRPRMSREPKRA